MVPVKRFVAPLQHLIVSSRVSPQTEILFFPPPVPEDEMARERPDTIHKQVFGRRVL
jgi:hypothetical protein